MIYFTADSHLNHKNICRGTSQWDNTDSARPFAILSDMNDYITACINQVVAPDDVLYHLGDFAFGDKSQIPTLRKRINCRTIHLIMGNHDHHYVRKLPELFDKFTSTQHYMELRYHKLLFSMMHYPLGSWNEIGRGGINIFGHCHGNYKRGVGRQMDVGVDVHNYRPISIQEVYDAMIKIDPVLVDGHDEDTNYG